MYVIRREILQTQIAALENDPHVIDSSISMAFDRLETIIRQNKEYLSDLDKALKSTMLDNEIDRALYSASRTQPSQDLLEIDQMWLPGRSPRLCFI